MMDTYTDSVCLLMLDGVQDSLEKYRYILRNELDKARIDPSAEGL